MACVCFWYNYIVGFSKEKNGNAAGFSYHGYFAHNSVM